MKRLAIWMLAAIVPALCGCPDGESESGEPSVMYVTRSLPFYDFTEERGCEIAATADTIEQFDMAGRLICKKSHSAGADKITIMDGAAMWRLTTDCYGWDHSDAGHNNKLRVCRVEFRHLPANGRNWELTEADIDRIVDFR